MPISISGNNYFDRKRYARIPSGTYDYTYPNNLKLVPGSKLHEDIVDKILEFADEGYNVVQRKFPVWQQIDEQLTGYIPLSDYEKNLKSRDGSRDDMHGLARPVSIVVPSSFAQKEAILTYLSQALLTGPLFEFSGFGAEDEIGARLLSLVVQKQVDWFNADVVILHALDDALKYGICPTGFEWVERMRQVRVRSKTSNTLDGAELGETVTESLAIKKRAGSGLFTVDPYRVLADPNVDPENIDTGEFYGWASDETFYDLLIKEADGDSLFNVEYLRGQSQNEYVSRFAVDQSHRDKSNMNDSGGAKSQDSIKTTRYTHYHTVVYMFIKLIPSEWKLGDSGRPELWQFGLVDDSLLIMAEKVDLYHGTIPVAQAAPLGDGHTAYPISKMETLHGLQFVLNWMFNSHVANVRKSINDMFIVDPSLITLADLQDPQPGKVIRLRRAAWGRGIKDAIQQLVVNDVTKSNVSDSGFIMELMNRVGGASDQVQGVMRNGPERMSAAEFGGTFKSALSRLELLAWNISRTYMGKMANLFASHTQQFMDSEVMLEVLGSWPEALQKIYPKGSFVHVDPMDLQVDFDLVYKDGRLPNGGGQDGMIWKDLFQVVAASPELAQMFDVPRIFMHVASILGAKDPTRFIREGALNMQVMPDSVVADEASKGNVVPLRGM